LLNLAEICTAPADKQVERKKKLPKTMAMEAKLLKEICYGAWEEPEVPPIVIILNRWS